MSKRRVVSLLGSVLVADGLPFLLNPAGQTALWSSASAPSWYRRMMRFFGERPAMCRGMAAAELAIGAFLLNRSVRST